MNIDSHQHFWRYDEAQYPWIPKGSPLHRDWLPDDLAPLLAQAGLEGSVAVQARQSLAESRWLLELADQHPRIKGVVGWVDLRSPEVGRQLAEFAPHPKFVGVRHVVQDEPDDQFMLRPDFLRGIAQLKEFDLTYDILIFPKQLPAAIELVKRFPEQLFVLDHIAKPPIKGAKWQVTSDEEEVVSRVTCHLSPEWWREQIRELAKSGNVLCKVSGMVTESDWKSWKPDDLKPYQDVVFEAFGEDRLMYGSDWPVCQLAGTYEQVHRLAHDYVTQFCGRAQRKVFGENAARFYGLAS